MSAENAKGSLDGISLFQGLPPDALRQIEDSCTWKGWQADELIFDKDNDTLDVYFVVEGSVRISSVVSRDRELALADIQAGQYFGEIAAIDGLRRSARVVALDDCRLASLSGPLFVQAMTTYPSIALNVMARLTRIVRELDTRVISLSSQNEFQRVWSHLIRLAEKEDVENGRRTIRDMPNHKEIAVWAGTSRETVAQAIGELARIGVVKRRLRGLAINDLDRLKLMVGIV